MDSMTAFKIPLPLLLSLTLLIAALSGCRGLGTNPVQNHNGSLNDVNHIIFMAQENRGFDHYFGAMRQYWKANGFKDQQFDGLAQFNPVSGIPPLQGPAPVNTGCDPSSPPPGDCVVDANNPLPSFAMVSMCFEN